MEVQNLKTHEEDYFFPLETLSFSQDYLKNFVAETISPEDWYVFDCGKTRWTVQEDYGTVRTECTAFVRTEWFLELYRLFTVPINFGDILFTRTPPPGIPPHVDRNRPAAINFPVSGNFTDSPILWYNSFDRKDEVARFYHSQQSSITSQPTALLFNPQKIHGVINAGDIHRCLLSIWWRGVSYEQILKMWLEGTLINWEVNEQNRLIKVIR